jgi:transposase-like protein
VGQACRDRWWCPAGTTTDDARRIVELERENRELKRANTILRQLTPVEVETIHTAADAA